MEINGPLAPDGRASLRSAAVALEASFLTEMLRAASFSESRGTFGGGIGEDQFASMLAREHAHAPAEAGGIGLAESIFQSLVRSSND